MSDWDRRALLRLVCEAEHGLHDPKLSLAQQRALQGLLEQYGKKAKSVDASPFDVQTLETQLRQIHGLGADSD